MTDRARLVYALIRSLFWWVPDTVSRSPTSLQPAGFVSGVRACLHCRRLGQWNQELRRRVDPGCPHCGGTGLRPVKDPMDDPVKRPSWDARRKAGFGGIAGDDMREARRLRDEEIERVGRQLSAREEDAPDRILDAVARKREHQYRHGSYAELERALGWLRERYEPAYELLMGVAYHPFLEPPLEPVDRVIVQACELLALWVEGEVRVPGWVAVSASEELEARLREGKGALWWGKREWHDLSRRRRRALIVEWTAEGLSNREIGRRLNLSVRQVRRLRAEAMMEQVNDANGEAA